jgi:hypothetical protein
LKWRARSFLSYPVPCSGWNCGSTEAFAALVQENFEMYRKLVADLKIRVN